MNKTIIIAILLSGFKLYAQSSIEAVLTEIEKNNTTLSAYRKSMDAEKTGHKTGLTPNNPEVEFNYLWGNPSAIGNRTDFSLRQSFDFPTAYRYRSQISELKTNQAEIEYLKQRNEKLFEALMVCNQLTYLNALHNELDKQHADAVRIAEAFNSKFNAGEVGILAFNKSQLHLLNIVSSLRNNEMEKNILLSKLTHLNGGEPVQFSDSMFTMPQVATDFEMWYAMTEADIPLLQWLKQETDIAHKEVKLNTALNMPSFYGGYMSEKVVGQKFEGVTIGIAIPLWENKNKVKYARLKASAMQSIQSDAKMQFFNQLHTAHSRVIALQTIVDEYRNNLLLHQNSELLQKAFDKGEISLTEYLFERALHYEYIENLLNMELELATALAELFKYQL